MTNVLGEIISSLNMEYCEPVSYDFCVCVSVVNNLKEKKLPTQVNRYRFDLILIRRY